MKKFKSLKVWLPVLILCILAIFVFRQFDRLADEKTRLDNEKNKILQEQKKELNIPRYYRGPRAPLTSPPAAPVPSPIKTNWRDIILQFGAGAGGLMSIWNLIERIFKGFRKVEKRIVRATELKSYGPAAPEQIAKDFD